MGKNLKGKECGKGIYQRKDGLYSARYYAKNGKRKEKYFETLPEAKNWLADARYEERHNLIVTSPDMTVDKWFEYWIENIVCDLAPESRFLKAAPWSSFADADARASWEFPSPDG